MYTQTKHTFPITPDPTDPTLPPNILEFNYREVYLIKNCLNPHPKGPPRYPKGALKLKK